MSVKISKATVIQRLIARINWYWRWLATALCFGLFGLGGLILSLCWFNLLRLLIRQKQIRRRLARHSICLSFRLFLFATQALGAMKVYVTGVEQLRADRGCLIVANHPTLLDYVLLASLLPDMDCLVKSALLRNPFVSSAIRAADYLLNSQADTLLPQCQQRLAQGDTLLIFPQGTRSSKDNPRALQRGAANIAVRCQCDVRIVLIHCSQPLLDKTRRWYQVPAAKPVFYITVSQRLAMHPASNLQPPSLAARRLNRQLTALLQAESPFIIRK